MTEQQHELLNRYEESLRKSITDFLSEQKELEGRLLEVEELNEMWRRSAPSYMADAVPEIIEASCYVSQFGGGKGCVRDIIEQVLRAHGTWALDSMGTICDNSVASR